MTNRMCRLCGWAWIAVFACSAMASGDCGWGPFGAGVSGTVHALTTWDPDGDGPLPAELVAGGEFVFAEGNTVNYVAHWDGLAWQPFGAGMSGPVYALTTWDPDDTGPLPPQLVAGGEFVYAGDTEVNNVARWDGTAWQPFGAGLFPYLPPYPPYYTGSVMALTTWDPDGAGPQGAALVAGGTFRSSGQWPTNDSDYIRKWDGTTWQSLHACFRGAVLALASWDPDGDGTALLVAGGKFRNDGYSCNFHHAASYDGTTWRNLEQYGITGDVYALTSWDSDGPGPLGAQIVLGGAFSDVNPTLKHYIASWDGVSLAYAHFATGFDRDVRALTTWDPDGDGPEPAQLIAGGAFTLASHQTAVGRIARWDGSQWHPVGTGTDLTVRALAAWEPNGAAGVAGVVAGGEFTQADGAPAAHAALWTPCPWACAGDMNCDHRVDFADIDRFVEALSYPDGVDWPYAECAWDHGDCDGDNWVTYADIDPFVSRLGAVCAWPGAALEG